MLASNARDAGSNPGQEAKTPYALWQKTKKNIKQKQNCNKFSTDFRNGAYFKNSLKKGQRKRRHKRRKR